MATCGLIHPWQFYFIYLTTGKDKLYEMVSNEKKTPSDLVTYFVKVKLNMFYNLFKLLR